MKLMDFHFIFFLFQVILRTLNCDQNVECNSTCIHLDAIAIGNFVSKIRNKMYQLNQEFFLFTGLTFGHSYLCE